VKPDYNGGSIVNLMASVAAAFGAQPSYPAARALGPDEIGTARNVVLLVVDGLGYRFLERATAGAALRSHMRGAITSVFPSTTAAGIGTFMTGLAPQQHGLTGWHVFFRELGAILAVLPFRPRHNGCSLAAAGITPHALFGNEPLFDRLQATSVVVSPAAIVDSDFTAAHAGAARRVGYRSAEEMFEVLRGLVCAATEQCYVYAYYAEIDAAGHAYGISSNEVQAELARLDAGFAAFLTAIAGTDTLVIVTADHGFIDTRPETMIELEAHPALADTLMLPLCGEPRIAYCYVRPGENAAFENYVERRLGHCADLVPSHELVAQGWFGPGVPHPRLADRTGHYALMMKDSYAIRDFVPGDRRHPLVGVHGGTSDEEILVPLIVTRR
jgi:hypothetical protein